MGGARFPRSRVVLGLTAPLYSSRNAITRMKTALRVGEFAPRTLGSEAATFVDAFHFARLAHPCPVLVIALARSKLL